jgi:glycosylphosphatidylinositol transamidase (GPIT) subunit GPI8
MHSTPGISSKLMKRKLSSILITDFFGGVTSVELTAPTTLQLDNDLETLKRLHRDHQETLKNLVIEIIIFSLIVIMLLICILLQESALN